MEPVCPCCGKLVVASWNVQGLSEVKLWELVAAMKRHNIGILCIQETHVKDSFYYTTYDVYFVILSGATDVDREYAGVGFIIAPWLRRSVSGFLQYSNRLACLKLRCSKGVMALISAYAPYTRVTHSTPANSSSRTFLICT